jgi:hypothetical protein
VNVLSNQLWTGNKGCPPGWWLGKELTSPHCKKPACYEMLKRASELDVFFGMTSGLENGHEIWNIKC